MFFPKEKMTDSELIKLNLALRAPGMSNAALQAVSIPAASLAAWLWAVLRYGLAQRRGLPTGLLLRQVEATLAREQAHLGHYQFQAQEILEHNLALNKKLQDAQAFHSCVVKSLSEVQCGQYHEWPIKPALLTPMQSWTTELQVTGFSQSSLQSSFLHHCPHSSALPCALTAFCPILPSLPRLAPSLPDPLPIPSSLAYTPSDLPFHTRS